MKPTKELKREEIAPALAEAQGMVFKIIAHIGSVYLGGPFALRKYDPLTNNFQYNKLTLNPEIHAGMIDVLDEWFPPQIGQLYMESTVIRYHHNSEYLQDIRLWQLRAVVEYLRRQK